MTRVVTQFLSLTKAQNYTYSISNYLTVQRSIRIVSYRNDCGFYTYSITCADSWHLSRVRQVPSLILNQHTYITIQSSLAFLGLPLLASFTGRGRAGSDKPDDSFRGKKLYTHTLHGGHLDEMLSRNHSSSTTHSSCRDTEQTLLTHIAPFLKTD